MLAIVVSGCPKSQVGRFDQTHIAYNAVASAALAYAESPETDQGTAKLISDIIVRTAGVIENASVVADLPQTDETERYLQWAGVVVNEGMKQLQAYLIQRTETEPIGDSA
jgi:hypothetical protein